jgi:large subunit ribosomal protein L13e
VGLNKHFARSVGITVDTRRTNKSNESLQKNILRLKEYLGKLVLLPRKEGQPKKGGYGKLNDFVESTTVVQNQDRVVLPLKKAHCAQKSKKITKEMNQFNPKAKLGLEKMLKKQHNKKSALKEEEN